MKRLILGVVTVVGLSLLWGTDASAQGFGHGGCYGNAGGLGDNAGYSGYGGGYGSYSAGDGGIGGYGGGYGVTAYGGIGGGGIGSPSWHNTSHYDYHPAAGPASSAAPALHSGALRLRTKADTGTASVSNRSDTDHRDWRMHPVAVRWPLMPNCNPGHCQRRFVDLDAWRHTSPTLPAAVKPASCCDSQQQPTRRQLRPVRCAADKVELTLTDSP